MQRFFIFSILYIFSISQVYPQQNTGAVKGTVKTSDGQPAEFVSIKLKGINKGEVSNKDGAFIIKNIGVGSHILVASFVGLETKEQNMVIKDGDTTKVDFVLKENAKQLEQVVITSSWNKFALRTSEYISRMPLKTLENSQVYNTVTKELAKEQVATSIGGFLKNAPGVAGGTASQPNLGRSQLMLRGFSQIFTLKNGMYVNSNHAPDPISIEKLDIVKGPSATLFGAAGFGMSYGGFVNQQTKKPYETLGGEIGYSGGSYGLSRITSDINLPLNAEKTILFRLNTAIQTEGNFKNYGFQKSFAINPSFLYKSSDKLTFRAEFDIQHNILGGYTFINPVSNNVTAKNWKDVRFDYNSSYGSDNTPNKIRYYDVYLQAEYKLSEKWKSQTNLMHNSFNFDGQFVNVNLLSDSTLRRTVAARYDHLRLVTNVQQNFIGDFKIGKFRNRLLIGADYTGDYEPKQSFYGATVTLDTINYIKRKEKQISAFDFNARVATAGFDNFGGRNKVNIYGFYFSDVFNITSNLLVMGGLRYDIYHNQITPGLNGEEYPKNSQKAFSPKFGAIYQPLKDKVSIFANYQNGFTNNFSKDAQGNQFKPEQANQIEAGVKLSLTQRLSGSLSYYDITVEDKLRTDPNNPNFSVQDGTQNNKGFEADLIYNPVAGLNILVGYGHVKAKYTKSNKDVLNKQPAFVSPNIANFWISYRISNGKAKGLGAGFGGNYTSKAFQNDVNTFIIPGNTFLDATVFYDAAKYRIGLKANNIADIKSWNRFGSQVQRNFAINLTAKF